MLSILKAIELGFQNILYVDIDAHHCDGVQDVFKGNENVKIDGIDKKILRFLYETPKHFRI